MSDIPIATLSEWIDTPAESIRSVANRCGIRIVNDVMLDFPDPKSPAGRRFYLLLAKTPQNEAQRIMRDIREIGPAHITREHAGLFHR